jgi:transposase
VACPSVSSWRPVDNHRVAKNYLHSQLDELMLLPPDVRDWLPGDHVVWFLLDAVAAIDTSSLHGRAKLGGAGRAPYHPDMLLALLVYAYTGGLSSSRKIERRCREDAAFMVVSGLRHPDHVTISRFRKDNDAAMEALFEQVLRLCGRLGMGALGHVAIDGTKIEANASRAQSRDADGLRRVARRLLDEAAKVDDEEDALFGDERGDELPEPLRDPVRRREVIADIVAKTKADADRARGKARARKADKAQRALALVDELEADAGTKAETRLRPAQDRLARSQAALARFRAETQARNDARSAREAAAAAQERTLPGTRPVAVEDQVHIRNAVARVDRDRQALAKRRAAEVEVTGKRNLTDPDSRFMPVKGGGFILGYNSQLAVSADYLILAVDVVPDPGDDKQLVPMLNKLDQAVNTLREATANPDLTVGTALFDAGYDSTDNLQAPGPRRLIALGKRHNIAGDHPPTAPPDDHATPRQKMAWLLTTDEGKALYKKRGATVEPVNSHLKDQRGLRRYSRRGITAATAELRLASLATNLLRLFTTRPNALREAR